MMKKFGNKLMKVFSETSVFTPSCMVPNSLGNIKK